MPIFGGIIHNWRGVVFYNQLELVDFIDSIEH